jgi:MFS family permease
VTAEEAAGPVAEPAAGSACGLGFATAAGRWVLAATVLGSGMAQLDATGVSVALPTIGRDLQADVATLQLVVTAYSVTLAALILLAGTLGDRLGRRRVFVVGVVWFTAASLLCAIAPNTVVLIVARALGDRGGAVDAGQPGDHPGGIHACRSCAGDRRVVGAGWRGGGARSVAGRLSRPGRVVAGDLLD